MSFADLPTDIRQRMNEHASGCIAGVALGDSMGMPGELWSRDHIRRHFGKITGFLPGPDGHFVVDGFKAGRYTDDTEQTLMLAKTIIAAEGEVRCEDVARELVAWADRVGACEGNFLGPTSAKAIELLRTGADPRSLAADGETNGASMRIAPIGIVRSLTNVEDFLDAVEESCRMSHYTSVAIAGASLIAGVTSAIFDSLASGNDPDLMTCVDAGIAMAERGATRGQDSLTASMAFRAQTAVAIAREAQSDEEFSDRLYNEIGGSVQIIESAPAALGLFVRGQGDPMTVALLAANLGGDTDTIGAMACGMSGAFSGISAIPNEALDLIASVNGRDFLEIDLLPYRR